MLEEKIFRRIISAITILVIVVVCASYVIYYKKQPVLKEENVSQTNKTSEFPIELYEAYAMTVTDLKAKLGNPKKIGNGSDYENQFLDYEQKWFGKNFVAKYYYGDYKRIYQTNIKLKKDDIKPVYEEMKMQLGSPIVDIFFDSKIEDLENRITYWIKDSVMYSLVYDDDSLEPYIKMKLAYYKNPDEHNVGDRPIIIQRMNNVKGIVPDQDASILLIGSKSEYTSTYYNNIYVLIGSKSGSYLGRFPRENDGGFIPNFKIIEKNGSKQIIVETDNEYTKWYTAFEFKDKKINVLYSDEKMQE